MHPRATTLAESVRNAFAVVATDPPTRFTSLVRIFVWNGWVALIWLPGAFVEDYARAAVWLVALLAD